MVLNDLGKITEQYWNEIPRHYPNVELDYCAIMPNHVHGIIIINDIVETGYIPSLRELKKHSLGDIVGKFKAAVTREIRKSINSNFQWQSRFYDRIIRNEKELYQIRKYIMQNPLSWKLDKSSEENFPDWIE